MKAVRWERVSAEILEPTGRRFCSLHRGGEAAREAALPDRPLAVFREPHLGCELSSDYDLLHPNGRGRSRSLYSWRRASARSASSCLASGDGDR